MAQKKDKNVKVKDLAPKKDAKGGGGRSLDRASTNAGGRNLNAGGGSLDGGGRSLDRASGAN